MEQLTHLKIDTSLCGKLVSCSTKEAKVALQTDSRMVADAEGLIHGGFLFGAADFAAMCAVNAPNVVLTGSTSRFIAPSREGDLIEFTAKVTEEDGPKGVVEVVGVCLEREVFTATFKTYVTNEHVLKGR